MKVVIMCGISGSGKSTYIEDNFPHACLCSADFFFVKNGEYKFDVSKLSYAHGQCLKDFVYFVDCQFNDDTVIVVDNTNTTAVEIAPYAALALAYGHELEIIMLECDPEVALKRGRHGCDKNVVLSQHKRLQSLSMPPWWPVRRVKT